MLQTVSVTTSGVALSLLLYENIKTEHNKNGFLLGEVISKESRKLTDADHRVVNVQRIINIKSIVPCPQEYYFYDYSGEINETKLKLILGNEMKNVVGWYIFKRKCSSPPKLTFREKIIHKRLMEYFEHPAYFSCGLLTSDRSKSSSNCTFIQTFVRYNMPDYENVPLHINNLSDPNFKFKSSESSSKVLDNLITTIKKTNKAESLDINNIQDNLQEYIKKLVIQLPEKEKKLYELEQEVRELKCRLRQADSEIKIEDEIKEKSEISIEDESKEEITENGVFSDHQNSDTLDSKKRKLRNKSKPVDIKICNNIIESGDGNERVTTRSKKKF